MIVQVFIAGLRASLRPRLLLPLYLVGLLIGVLQTWPLLVGAAGGGLRNPLLGTLAAGGADTLARLLIGSSAGGGIAGLWALATLPLVALWSLAYNFFSGGILCVWAGSRSFSDGCRRTFAPFVGLGALLLLLLAGALLLSALLAALVGGLAGLLAALLLIQAINLLGEYARAIAVAHDRRNPLWMLARAAALCWRQPGVPALALLGLLLHGALAALFLAIQGVAGGTLLGALVQQATVLAWLWVKLLRLAWALGYVRAEREARPA